jgi:hypothetical protein
MVSICILFVRKENDNKCNNEFGDPMRWDYNFDYRENKIFRYSKYC